MSNYRRIGRIPPLVGTGLAPTKERCTFFPPFTGQFPMRAFPASAAGLVVAALAAGCAEKPAPEPVPPVPPAVVDINALDFAFQAPDTIPGGWVTLRVSNGGQEFHHAAMYRLEQGKTVADLAALQAGDMPAWLVAVGGPNAAVPGAAIEATVNLPAGNYVILCEIPSPDGKLHLMKGMMKPLTVTAPAGEIQVPVADVTIKLSDFAFEITPALAAGTHTFRVETMPGQPHEVLIARLVPGKKAEDVLAWTETMTGPPPVEGIVGGTTSLGQGEVIYFTGELTAGDYAVICFLPDVKDSKPHAVHGMMRTVTVM